MSVAWQKRTHGVPVKREKIDPQAVRLYILAGGVIAVLMALYLAISASNTKLSVEIWSMHNDLSAIQRENSRLEIEIARESSISVLIQRSVAMGYAPAESVEFVTVGAP